MRINNLFLLLVIILFTVSCGELKEITGIDEFAEEEDKKEDDELSGLDKLQALQEEDRIRLTGFFIDAAVEGISYKSSFSGTTDSSGRYFYYAGDNVSFQIGDISLGTVIAKTQLTPVDLASSAITDQKTVNILRFLQTLDDDGDPSNGIKIPAAVSAAAVGMSVNFDQTTTAFETAVATDISTLTSNLSIGTTGLTSASVAVAHFQSTVTTSQSTDNQITAVENAPTDISLSSSSVDDGSSSGTTVGTFSTTDTDSGDEHTYSLVSGTGNTDNSSFSISGTTLSIATSVNYSSQTSYSIRVRSTDLTSQTYEEALTINVNGIALSSSTVAESSSSGTTVGTLTGASNGSDAVSFSLVSGTGSTDNSSFSISGSNLLTAASLDFETQSSYSIRVQLVNAIGGTYEQVLTITVTDVSESPTDIALSASTVAENSSSGTTIGTLSCTDADSSSFTYSLVSGTGDTDNASFSISGSTLSTAASFDYETATSKSIRIQCSDGSNTYSEALTISVTNVNEAPTDIALSASTIDLTSTTTVGTLSATDVDSGDSHTFSLASSSDSFSISGSTLSAVQNATPTGSNSITIRATDASGLTYDETITVTVSKALLAGAIQGTSLSLATSVTTFVGDGSRATTDGTGTAAALDRPFGITTDGTNLYVTETADGHTIRKIVISTGVVTTLAGSDGTGTSTDGTGTAATFNQPNGITTDGTNLYVSEAGGSIIRQVVISTGVVTTLAGDGTTGNTDGTGTAASFDNPNGLVIVDGNLYVAAGNLVRKIVISTGVVTTFAGDGTGATTDGTGTTAQFHGLRGMTTDGTNLYVTEQSGNVVRKIVIATAVVTTLAGDGNAASTDGTGTAASFNAPQQITTDGTNLYLINEGNHSIRKIVISTGAVTTLAGGTQGDAEGIGTAAQLKFPTGITTDGTYLYVTDRNNNKIRIVR